MTTNLDRRQTVLAPLPQRARRVITARPVVSTLALAGAALYGLANAEGGDAGAQLTTAAKASMEGAVPLIVGLLVVGIGITVAFFVNRNAKKGIKSAG